MLKQKGFTLIELVIVIVILGILAVTAAPRFLNLSNDAHKAAVAGAKAAFEQGISFAHAAWLVETDGAQAATNLSGYADGTLDTNELGYPVGIDKNEDRLMPYNIGKHDVACAMIWNTILNSQPKALVPGEESSEDTYVGQRVESEITTKDGDTITAKSKCKYAYLKSGFNEANPFESKYVLEYNSRTGQVKLIQ